MTVWRDAAALFIAAAVFFSGLTLPAGGADRRLGADVAKPAAAGAAWTVKARLRLAGDLDTLIAAAPTLRGAHIGVLALDTRSGDVLYARNADDAFVPASTLKLLTGSVALAVLGPSFRFHTAATIDPANRQLVIIAGGDPLLNAADLAQLAQAVRAARIVALPAGIAIDAGAFDAVPYPPGWSWDDLAYDYAPAVSAAIVEENVVHLTVSAGPAYGAPVQISIAPERYAQHFPAIGGDCPSAHAVTVASEAITAAAGSAATLDLARRPGNCIDVNGSLAIDAAPQTLDAAVPDPVWYLWSLSAAALRGAGVAAGMPAGPQVALPDGHEVWSHDGEPLGDELADMWWPSDNLIAEVLLKTIGARRPLFAHQAGSTEAGLAAEREWLRGAGIDTATVTLADGSGLSSYDRLTPRALTAVLQADWNGPFRDLVLDDLPLAGVRGTLERRFAGTLAERRTFAKTGSVNHSRALSGYLATERHGAVTFALMVDDWMGADADLDALRARVLSRIIGD